MCNVKVKNVIFFIFFVLLSFFVLFLSPLCESFLLSDQGGRSYMISSGQVDVRAMDEVVLLHVDALRV